MICPHCGKELPAGVHMAFMKHGHSGGHPGTAPTQTYRSWKNMIARCTQPSSPSFKYYNKLGIKVCQRWRRSFVAFLKDMGEAKPGLSIDRINTLRGYYPGNCRWATKKEQANNRVTNKVYRYRGKKYTISQIAEMLGRNKSTMAHRVGRLGWSFYRAVKTPIRPRS